MPKPKFELMEETKILIQILRTAKEGEFIEYGRLSAAIGGDIQERYSLLVSARAHVQENDGIVFRVLVNEGVERLNNLEKSECGAYAAKRAARAAYRGEKILRKVDWEKLNPDERKAGIAGRIILGIQRAAARHENKERLLAGIKDESNANLPPPHVLMQRALAMVSAKQEEKEKEQEEKTHVIDAFVNADSQHYQGNHEADTGKEKNEGQKMADSDRQIAGAEIDRT